jgi:hypothetical protein
MKIFAMLALALSSSVFAQARAPELLPSIDSDIVARCSVPVQEGVVPQPFLFTVSKDKFSIFVTDTLANVAIETISDIQVIADEIPADVLPEMPCSNDKVRLGYFLNANMVRVQLLNTVNGQSTVVSSKLYQLSNTYTINVN